MRGTRKRTRRGICKKANNQRRATWEGNTKSSRKQTEKGLSSKRSEPQRFRERRGGKSCLIWVFSHAKAQKNSNLFSQSSFDTSFSLQFKSRFGKTIIEWFSKRKGTSVQNGARSKSVDKKLNRERRRVVVKSDLAVVATRILTSAF